MTVTTAPHLTSVPRTIHIGSVSFLNAKPLIYGLEEAGGMKLDLEVPSKLLEGLEEGRFDVALLPVIDYQRMPNLHLLTSGGISSDGPTMTVRIFSPCPISQIPVLACDTDSHTSVALARILLAEVYGIRPNFIPLNASTITRDVARLLIGDKVVCEEPAGLDHQLDLGEAWKRHTGLPFVFAAWMGQPGVPLAKVAMRLQQAKEDGRANIDSIITRYAIPRGWPVEIAREYLTRRLQYDITPRHLKAIELFHRLAFDYGLITRPPDPLRVVQPSPN